MTSAPDITISPSILDCDFGHLAEQIALVEPSVKWLHLDIMDGHFVPNLSIGVPIVKAVRQHSKLFLDTHLMITDPGKYAEPFVKAGADLINFHIEVVDDAMAQVQKIRDLGAKVGITLNPGTPAEAIWDVVEAVDLVLVMTVWPGFGGQQFMTECLKKISAISERLNEHQHLQVDGGINNTTAPLAVKAGANNLVAGSAIFKAPDPASAVDVLQSVAQEAVPGSSMGQEI